MLIPRELSSISKVCDSDSRRYSLGGVRLERNTDGNPVAVATDGRRMLVAEWTEPESINHQEDKTVADFATIVAADDWQAVHKGLSTRKKLPKPDAGYFRLDEPSANGTITMEAPTDPSFSGIAKREVRAAEGRFPNWHDVTPDTSKGYVKTSLNARYLRELCEILDKVCGDDENRAVSLFVPIDGEAPTVIRHETEGRKAHAVLMPMSEPVKSKRRRR